MAAQMADMPWRRFQRLSLGTGFERPPYWIYHGFGFRGIAPGRGEMLWTAGEDAEAELFRPGRVVARDARWDDWGFVAWLGLLPVAPDEELPRSRVMRLKSRGIMEGAYVRPVASGLRAAPPLRTAVLRGLGRLTGAQGARQALQLGFRVLLIRLLSPADFGLLGMVTVVSGFILMFSDLGFGPALVRKETVTEAELSTVFWLNVATGIVLALATAALGPALARFYQQPALIPICMGLSCASLVAPLGTVPHVLLQRRFAFRGLAAIDVGGIAVGGAAGVFLAAIGHGVWALVW